MPRKNKPTNAQLQEIIDEQLTPAPVLKRKRQEIPPPPPPKESEYSDSDINLTDEELPRKIRRKNATKNRKKSQKRVSNIQKMIKKEDMMKPNKENHIILREKQLEMTRLLFELHGPDAKLKEDCPKEKLERYMHLFNQLKYGNLQEMACHKLKQESEACVRQRTAFNKTN